MKKRRPVLILELFIALFLMATCLIPLVGGVPLFFSKAMKQLRAIEYERLADLTYIELKTNLPTYLNWKDLNQTLEYNFPETELRIGETNPLPIHRSAKISVRREFSTEENIKYRLLNVAITLNQHKYEYKLIVFHKEEVNLHA